VSHTTWARIGRLSPECSLELNNLHTGERVKATFDRTTGPDQSTLAELQYCLRDHRLNEQHVMDADLYGLLATMAQIAGCAARYEVICGYRSPATNAQLRAAGHGVAEHSLHMEGRAIDVRLEGCDLEVLHDVALKVARGGVGFYPSSNFVHVDTGRVRTWTGR
jgi:uncharacterized protein YcbK (DUF882 family)